ncbi:stage V sporulation protein AD [Ruminococcus flavefaciens]|uniref:Stage V sporulation protein AD n=1 Tax=Ruminococcus flavefaciens TaxID=1265 RepID=A0A1M7MHK0_RUMFL|nr:stage V sporulation protein AD [Ruminococcus flavefaciens]SHM89879.1 stage V sporulation protein AD [Ruminococcus flavefaciens]
MAKRIDRGVFQTETPVKIKSYAAVVGEKEGQGPLGSCFDKVVSDSHFGKATWEQAESRFQLEAVGLALRKAQLTENDLDVICAGDLINQCIGSAYSMRELAVPFLGLYGACSTMAEGLLIASVLTDCGLAENAAAVTSSHFSTAERQFRFPLSYGGQRTPTAQWTCTASGAVILSRDSGTASIVGGCVGRIADLNICDINNMGSAMAPAAADTISRYLSATDTSPADYDFIVTGDLGLVGSKLLLDILMKQGIDISAQHRDCGAMIFDPESQDTHCGGSGCGCGASVLCGNFLPMLERDEIHSILFAATGALMSPMSMQQGESIPAISHLIHIRKDR